MKTGLVIYATNLDELAMFYIEVFNLVQEEGDDTYRVLEKDGFEIVLLVTETTQQISNKEPRTNTAMKPAFFIQDSLENISEKVEKYGGLIYKPKGWKFKDRVVCDGNDCEGNIFQLRILNGQFRT